MARPQKMGLDYFPQDVDVFTDRRMISLSSRWGGQGVAYYLYLLSEIFKGEGYYLRPDADCDDSAALYLRMEVEQLCDIRAFLVERGVFDRELYEREGVLSSAWVQSRYQMAVRARGARHPIKVREDYWLLLEDETENYIQICPPEHLLQTYATKKRKVKKSKTKQNQIIKQHPSHSGRAEALPADEDEHQHQKENEAVLDAVVLPVSYPADVAGKDEEAAPVSKREAADAGLTGELQKLRRCYCENIGRATAAVTQELRRCLEGGTDAELLRKIIERSALNGAHSWQYIRKVLDDCARRGITTPGQLCTPQKREGDCAPGAASSSIDFDAIERYLWGA